MRTLVDAGGPRVAVVALNDDIADGRDVSWIWDADFEPLIPGLDRLVASGSRAAELALRFAYGGLARDRIEVVPDLDGRSTAAWSSRPRRRADGPPHLHRDARAAPDRGGARPRQELLGAGRMKIRARPSLPRLPEHLRRPRQCRRARRAGARARPRAGGGRDRDGRAGARGHRPLLHRRRPGPRAGPRRARSGGEGARRSPRPSTAAPSCWRCAAATSCWAASTGTSRAASCPASGYCRCRPSRAHGG